MSDKEPKTEKISISKSELDSLIQASVAAALQAQAATQESTNGSDPKAIAAAFAEAMRPVLEATTDSTKRVVDGVLEKTGRTQNDMQAFPNISVFNPRGERDFPKPKLVDGRGKARNTFYCGQLMNSLTDVMTVNEIELFNQFQTDCEARDGAWTAVISKNGSTEVLTINIPMGDNDTTRHLPTMEGILYELLAGEKMPDVNAIVTKLVAKSANPKNFIANLERLLEQANQPVSA